jgi:hypothetical protein
MSDIWALAVTSFLLSKSLWKSKATNASFGLSVVGPSQRSLSRPPLANLET